MLLLTDDRMAGMGLDLAAEARAVAPCLLMAGLCDAERARAAALGIEVIVKRDDADAFVGWLGRLVGPDFYPEGAKPLLPMP